MLSEDCGEELKGRGSTVAEVQGGVGVILFRLTVSPFPIHFNGTKNISF